jgi:hypothetical protein
MFVAVNRRFFRRLALVLVAAQLLCAPPAASALAAMADEQSQRPHCAGQMPAGDASADCPCCPEGMNVAACLSSCTASVGAITSLEIPAARAPALPVSFLPALHRAAPSEPPLKPPPIA